MFQQGECSLEEQRAHRNAYYRNIRRAKDQCFEKWLQGDEEIGEILTSYSTSEQRKRYQERSRDVGQHFDIRRPRQAQ